MEELKRTLGFLFKRKGKEVLKEEEIRFSASIDLRWFTPIQANKLIEVGLESNLLIKTDNGLKANFHYEKIEIPFGFRPSTKILDFKKESVFLRILEKIVENSDLKKTDVVSQINKEQQNLMSNIEVAAIFVALKNNVDVSEFYDDVEKEILMEK